MNRLIVIVMMFVVLVTGGGMPSAQAKPNLKDTGWPT